MGDDVPEEIEMAATTEDRFHRRREAAQFLREKFAAPTSSAHLAKLAVTGGGPAYHKFSRFPIYRQSDLVSWAEAMLGQPRVSTSEEKSA